MSTSQVFEMPAELGREIREGRSARLWLLRILVHMDGASVLKESHRAAQVVRMMERLGVVGFPRRPSEEARDQAKASFATTLEQLERRKARQRLPKALENNLVQFGRRFSLGVVEREILALALLLQTDEVLSTVAHEASSRIHTREALAVVLGRSARMIDSALAPSSNLRRSGLMRIAHGFPLPNHLLPAQDGLARLVTERVRDLDELFQDVFRPACPATLDLNDYQHFQPQLDLARGLIRDATRSKRRGVNVLLYGKPGTGKTELSRLLAASTGVECLEVSNCNAAGDAFDALTRLANTAVAQRILARRRALLVFDEVDALFNDGSSFFGRPSTAETQKAWVNTLLEETPVPTVWIANRINAMDPAFLRRFDLVAEMPVPPLSARARMVGRLGSGALSKDSINRIARCDCLMPATLQRAASVAARVATSREQVGPLMEVLLDGNLRASGKAPLLEANTHTVPEGYDPALCNADHDLVALADGIARTGSGRMLLSGPPGTGKTAFGYWLSRTLDRPLLIKRVSDLQSPYLGEMEQRLAGAFREATKEDAVLQIDEIDSFLRDRREARQSWQVTQVNEFLTRLEAFDGVFIATTNLIDAMDTAALRRFDFHVQIGPMRGEQALTMLERWAEWAGVEDASSQAAERIIDRLAGVTPGDFARLTRRHRITPIRKLSQAISALESSVVERARGGRRIGFV